MKFMNINHKMLASKQFIKFLTKLNLHKTTALAFTTTAATQYAKKCGKKSICDPEPPKIIKERTDIDKPTHTGQVFAKDDYRRARFLNAKRYVNSNWGIDLIAQVPPIECDKRVVSCNGGGGALGHPIVFINLDQPGSHVCGYCGLRFIKCK